MRFSIPYALMGLCAISSVAASPVPAGDISSWDNGLTARTSSLDLTHGEVTNSARDTTQDHDAHAVDLAADVPTSSLAKRSLNSKFKIHVLNSSAKVIGIIIIDYFINQLPGNHESISADFDKLTNVKTNGPVVASHFENGANPFATAQNAVFDFSTRLVSGVVDLALDASGKAVSVAGVTGVHLGGTAVAKTLHFFNEANAKIGAHNI